MDISQNHVSYDESQHTLTVTTFYNERTFLNIGVQGVQTR